MLGKLKVVIDLKNFFVSRYCGRPLFIFFLLLLVNAVFAVVIANLFIANPGAVLPVWGSLVVALVVGFLAVRYFRWE